MKKNYTEYQLKDNLLHPNLHISIWKQKIIWNLKQI
jgi:hypothetical protein